MWRQKMILWMFFRSFVLIEIGLITWNVFTSDSSSHHRCSRAREMIAAPSIDIVWPCASNWVEKERQRGKETRALVRRRRRRLLLDAQVPRTTSNHRRLNWPLLLQTVHSNIYLRISEQLTKVHRDVWMHIGWKRTKFLAELLTTLLLCMLTDCSALFFSSVVDHCKYESGTTTRETSGAYVKTCKLIVFFSFFYSHNITRVAEWISWRDRRSRI